MAHWGGFSDPHTHIKEYRICVGTMKGSQDVVALQTIGLVKSKCLYCKASPCL